MISFFREVKQNKAILEYIALVIEVNEHYSITMNDIATLSHTIQKEMHNNASIWLDVQLSSSLINKGFRVSVYYLTEHQCTVSISQLLLFYHGCRLCNFACIGILPDRHCLLPLPIRSDSTVDYKLQQSYLNQFTLLAKN